MFKKSTLVLSTIAVLSLAEVSAQIFDCQSSSANCAGYFYEDINAAFVDCYNAKGFLESRKENFYTSPLEKECNSTTYASFNATLNGTSTLASTVSGTAVVEYCDYFEIGVGYQFTQADNGIGLVVVPGVIGGARDVYYRDLNLTNSTLYWDWVELAALIETYSSSQCANASANATAPAGSSVPFGFEAIIDWITKYADREVIAQCGAEHPVGNSSNSSNSTNSTGPVVGNNTDNSTVGGNGTDNGTVPVLPGNETNSTVGNGTNSTGNETNSTVPVLPGNETNSTVGGNGTESNGTIPTSGNSTNGTETNSTNGTETNSTIPDNNSTINSTVPDNTTNSTLPGSSGNSSVPVDNNSTNGTNNGTILPGGDNSTNSSNSTGNGTINPGGPIINVTTPVDNSTNNTNTSVPVDNNSTIPADNSTNATVPVVNGTNSTVPVVNGTNATNATVPVLNSTNVTNSTTNSTNATGTVPPPTGGPALAFFNSGNYTLASGCSYADSTNSSVTCVSGLRSVTFTFAQINQYWTSFAT
jgi:hypothetical protein